MTQRALPGFKDPTRGELVRFDLTAGLPTALSVLKRHLGVMTRLRVLLRYARLSLRDPLRALSTEGWDAQREALVRHQLRAAVIFDDALRPLVDDATRMAILQDVISETGSRFIEHNVPLPERATWASVTDAEREAFIQRATVRFFNADVTDVYAEGDMLGFDVGVCRFVQLTRQLDRPYLAPMFCAADSVFFERPSSQVVLERSATLATGGEQCDFRFRFKDM